MILTAPQVLQEVVQAPTAREQNQRLMAALAANGDSKELIAAKLDLTPEAVNAFLRSKPGIAMVIRLQQAYIPDPQQRVKKMAHSALDTLYALSMNAASETVQASCAKDIADRAMGKALQVVESRNINFDVSNAKDLDRAIEVTRSRIEELTKMAQMKHADAIIN